MRRFTALVAAFVFALGLSTANAAIIFDDFNVNEGRFALAPTFSGSTSGINTNSTADRVTTDSPLEGAGHQRLVLNDDATAGAASRLRHLSGGGAAGGASGQPANTVFTTGAGTDGWIGFYLKTNDPGWTAQIWIEGPENNGGIPKTVIADGNWHAYEWDLDDESGGANGWGAVAGIVAGDADVQAGNYTIDSVLLRHTAMANSTIYFDFVAKSDSGSIAGLLNSPPTVVDAVINNINASVPGSVTHLFTANDTETPAGPFTWDQLTFVSYTEAYGGDGGGPAQPAGSNPAMLTGNQFDWNTVGSPRGIYQWSVRATDPGGLSDTGTLTVHVTEVPEPSTLALFGLAMVGAIGLSRRS